MTGIVPAPLGHKWARNIAQNWAPKLGSEQSSIRQTADIVGRMLADIERNGSKGSRACVLLRPPALAQAIAVKH